MPFPSAREVGFSVNCPGGWVRREQVTENPCFAGKSLEDHLLLGEGVRRGSQMGGGPQARERSIDRHLGECFALESTVGENQTDLSVVFLMIQSRTAIDLYSSKILKNLLQILTWPVCNDRVDAQLLVGLRVLHRILQSSCKPQRRSQDCVSDQKVGKMHWTDRFSYNRPKIAEVHRNSNKE
jgi:hypothetical protein